MNQKQDEGLYNVHPAPFTCSLCGKTDDLSNYDPSEYLLLMHKHHVCFHCAFWMDKIQNPPVNREIINGHHYIIHPFAKRPHNVILGFGGHEFYIRRFDGTLIKSNNVWHQGKIPEHFRKDLPDTADFLTLMDFQKLKNDPYKCMAKGCWDRYHCLRYDQSCEKDGLFNIIPDSHIPGNEHCPSFVKPYNAIEP